MQYTQIRGLTLSRFTLGTVQLGMPYGMSNRAGQPTREEADRLLDTALSGGVSALDTAAHYGTSEDVLGEYRRRKPDAFPVVCTKFRLEGERPAEELEQSMERSRARLGLERIPVYLLHDASQMTAFGSLVPEMLARFREEGKIGVPGVSVYTAEEVETFLRCEVYGAIQIPMGALDTRLVRSGLLEELRARNVAVFVRSVYTQGLVLMDPLPEAYSFARDSVAELRAIARAEGMSVKQLAVSYIRDLPGVSSLVLGCETAAQVAENLALMEGPALSDGAQSAILRMETPIEAIMRQIQGKR